MLFPLSCLRSIAAAGLCLVAGLASAHDDDHPPVKVADATAHRPTAIADRIILTWSGDPATTQSVTWRTDATVSKALAQIAPASAAPKFVDNVKAVAAASQPLETNLGKAHFHSVTFNDLSPSSLYAYRVGDGVNWSEWFHFKTASDKAEPFSFIYFGDAQNDIKSLWARVIRGTYTDAPKAKFIVHAGDLIDHGTNDAEWGGWFSGGGWVNGMVPSIPTPGNHGYDAPEPNATPKPRPRPSKRPGSPGSHSTPENRRANPMGSQKPPVQPAPVPVPAASSR